MPLEVRLHCTPEQFPVVTLLTLQEGWSQTTRDRCLHVSAQNVNGMTFSNMVEQSYPADCLIPTPEPPGMLLAGLILMAIVSRRGRPGFRGVRGGRRRPSCGRRSSRT